MDAQGLAGPEQAKFVVSDGTSAPVITDGPFPESKELLAGYRIVDVESAERAVEIAARISAAPGAERGADPPAHRGARGDERPRSRGVTDRQGTADLLRDLAPRALGAVVRRYGHFADAEDAVQEALLAAATTWPAERHAGQPARLAHPGGLAQDGRPVPAATRRAGGARNWPPPGPWSRPNRSRRTTTR